MIRALLVIFHLIIKFRFTSLLECFYSFFSLLSRKHEEEFSQRLVKFSFFNSLSIKEDENEKWK
jgi:hypothetical protein